MPGRTVTLSWQGPAGVLARSLLIDRATGEQIHPGDQPDGWTLHLEGHRRQLTWTLLPKLATRARDEF